MTKKLFLTLVVIVAMPFVYLATLAIFMISVTSTMWDAVAAVWRKK